MKFPVACAEHNTGLIHSDVLARHESIRCFMPEDPKEQYVKEQQN